MSSLSSLLILAALAAPASEDRHVDAVEIFACDFGADWDVNYDDWPDLWTRRRSPTWPHYVNIGLADDQHAVAGRCLTVDLNGAGASISSPAITVSDKFSYVIEARIKASGLKHGQTHVRVDFLNEDHEVLESARGEIYQSTKGWKNIHFGPVNISHSAVELATITLQVDRGEHVDLEGQVSLDDVWLARLPRMEVHSNSPFNVYTDPNDVEVTCELSGILEKDPEIHFELLDASSHSLDDNTVQLEGRLITERVSIVKSTKTRHKGYAGSTRWKPPIKDFGFYRVQVSMQTAQGTLKKQTISIAVVPPIKSNSQGEFGWSLAGDDIPLDFDQLEELLPRVAIHWIKLPVWYGNSEPERGERLVVFTERLAAKDIKVVGVIDKPPIDLEISKRIGDDATIADLLSAEEPSAWLPSLDEVLTRLSLRVRWWQLGTDHDTSFSDFHDLEQEIGTLRGQLFRFGQEVNLGIGWPWNVQSPIHQEATWDFEQLSATPALTGAEIATYLQAPKRAGVVRWALIEPLDIRHYALETRTQDLVQQMLACKINGADGIFISQPFDDNRGIMSDAGAPGELLLPWRTTASLLSGAKYLGTLRLPEGSENRIFEKPSGEVFMVIWNNQAIEETLYLGDDIRVIDVWGRAEIPAQKEHRQIISVGSAPKFVLGLNRFVAKWRMNMQFIDKNIPSVFGKEHLNQIALTNSFRHGAGGSVTIVSPNNWQILPSSIDFKLSALEQSRRPFQVVLPFNASSGIALMRADFEVIVDKLYKFSVYRELVVGDEFIELELNTRLDEKGSLIIEQRMINNADNLVDFKCLLYAPDRRRQRMQVFRLGNSYDTKTYTYQNGLDLIGKELWLRAEELGGDRVLNHRIIVAQ
jgi:hypothetical protein